MDNITYSNDTKKYITDIIGDSYIDWEVGEFIFLSAHTGAGKSFFVMNTLLKHAISEGKTVSIFIPRNTLLKKYEFDLMKFLSFTSLDMDSLSEFVSISTYQNLENCIINGYEPKLGDYIICDEAHYFLSDSVFNVNTVLSYKYLTTHSPHSIKVLISATGERIFRYIKTKYSLPLYCSPEMSYVMPRESYRIYDIPADYSYLNIMYLDESWNVVDLYNLDRDGKWAIFVNSISEGKTYYKKLTDAGISATFLCSENMHENIDEISYITNLEKFSQQFLISTAVIETGVNFSDKNIRNIILLANTRERFIQMLGRRRITDEQELVNLFIPRQNASYFEPFLENLAKKLEGCRNLVFKDTKATPILKNLFSDTGSLQHLMSLVSFAGDEVILNELYLDELEYQANSLKELIFKLSIDENAFIKQQLSWLGLEDYFDEKNFVKNNLLDMHLENFINEVENFLSGEPSKKVPLTAGKDFLNKFASSSHILLNEKKALNVLSYNNFNKICKIHALPYNCESIAGSSTEYLFTKKREMSPLMLMIHKRRKTNYD